MDRFYIVTGAAGHLGGTIIRMLAEKGQAVRGLLLPGETGVSYPNVEYITGDVRDKTSLLPLFDGVDPAKAIVLHTAGIISIANAVSDALYDVNVLGTQNIIDLCAELGAQKLLYVSSVHALPEGDPLRVITEADHFSADAVVGGYAKTKAEATRRALEAARGGLNVTVVHPSGILGPYDKSGNHLVQMVADAVKGRLPAGVKGGYDFVDVRDVAEGCLAAAEKGGRGECYILSNRHYTMKELLAIIRAVAGGRRLPMLPMWMAKAGLPLLALSARLRHERPLYTHYALYTLQSNDRFSHDKATKELGYTPRDLYRTIQDTVAWMGEGARGNAGKAKSAKNAGALPQTPLKGYIP